MNEDQTSASLGFGQYLYVLRRQWLLVAVAAMLGGVAAAGYVALAPRTATATTTVNLNVIATEPFSAQRAPSGLLDDATETALAKSHAVAARAAELLGGDFTATEIRRASSVTTSSGAAVVTVEFAAESAQEATKGADAVASAYLSFRGDQAEKRLTIMIDGLTDRIDTLNETLGQVNEQLASAESTSAAYAQATTQRQQILTELDGLLSERNGLQSVDTTGGTVLSSAENNEVRFSPRPALTVMTGLGAGLVAGIVLAFVWNPFDRRLRNASEVSRLAALPVYSVVDAVGADVPARGRAAAALRIARERVLTQVSPGATLLVVDASRRDGLSVTSVNLAVVTAQAGLEVQLIVPEAGVDVQSELGASLELEQIPNSGRSRSRKIPELQLFTVVDAGEEDQGDPLLTRRTREAIDAAGEKVTTFLVLSSNAPAASALAGLRIADGVIVIARSRATTVTDLLRISDEAEQVGTPVIGAVVEHESKP